MTTAPSAERWRLALPLAAVLVWLLPLAAWAQSGEDLEARMREIASGLRCPVCQNLSVADSTSDLAREMRALIVDQLRAGQSPEEIRAYFVSKYGQWILLAPTPQGFGLLVWVLPGAGALAGLGGAAWALRRWARREPRAEPPVDEAALARVRAVATGTGSADDLGPGVAREVEALRELEFDYRAGKLSGHDYADLRATYETRAAAALAATRAAREAPRVAVPAERAALPIEPVRRPWRWAAGAVLLLVFGVALGVLLTAAVRPRGEGGSITGDPLTGTRGDTAGSDLHTLLARGQQALQAGDFKGAIGFFTRALDLDPEQPVAHAYLGLILLRAGHPDRALGAFERALAREPTLVPALWGKGLVLYESQGRIDEAIRTWEALLAQDVSAQDREHVRSLIAQARARRAAPPSPQARPPQ